MQTTVIEYIGKRETYLDKLYNTGLWARGQQKPVVSDTAGNMLRHADQYREVGAAPVKAIDEIDVQTDGDAEVVGKQPDQQGDTEEELQAERDAVSQMTKATLAEYANTHFGQKLDANMTVADMRAKVTSLIDQFGLS